ncbi:MAG: MFS transporter [Acidimicrobiales bacterium]
MAVVSPLVRRTLSGPRRAAQGAKSRSASHRLVLVTLLIATAAFRMTQNMAVTTLSLLARQAVHLGAGAIGILGAVTGLSVALVTLFLSRRVPHHHSALSAATGMVALTGSLLVLAVAPSFGVLVVGAGLLGAAGGVAMPGLLNAVVSQAGEKRERVIAIYTVTLSVSLAIGPLLETVVLSAAHQTVRLPYLTFAAFPLLGAGLIVFGQRRRSRRSADFLLPGEELVLARAKRADVEENVVGMSPEDTVTTAFGIGAHAYVATGEGRPGAMPHRWRRSALLSTQSGRLALVAQLLYGVPFAGITVFGAVVARIGFGASPARAQLGFTVFFVLSLGARVAVAWKAPITHKGFLLWISAALTAGGLVLFGLGHGLLALFVAMGLLGIPHGLTFPLALALVADATPVSDLPRAHATLLGSTNLTSVAVPLVLGAIIPAVGYQATTLVMLVPVGVFAFLQFGLRSRSAS